MGDRDEPALLPVLVAAMWPTIVTCTLLVPYLDVLDFAVFFCACEVSVAFCIFQRCPVHHFAASSSALVRTHTLSRKTSLRSFGLNAHCNDGFWQFFQGLCS